MTPAPTDRFWEFSLRFYGMQEVREACLRLQDAADLNVNLVLWCCWQACQGRQLTPRQTRAAARRISEWSRTVTRPLRALRRQVKAELGGEAAPDTPHSLYERLKSAELEAEKVEQTLLCAKGPDGSAAARRDDLEYLAKANLEVYMRIAGAPGADTSLRELPARLARRLAEMDGCP